MIKSNTCIDSLIAQYHEQVWEAAEKGSVAYDEAGLNVAKAILAKISAVEAERDQYRIAEQHQIGLRLKLQEDLDRHKRMFAAACGSLGEIQQALGNQIVGIEPALVKELLEERDALAAIVEWRPIEQADKYEGEFLLYGPSLIDLDFNEKGVVEGHWQDDMGWVGAVWCNDHDCWHEKVIEPTHFLPKFNPETSLTAILARRDALSQSEGLRKAAIFIEQKANSYDEEHGKTDPSTNHREYPGDGAEYYNDLMELAEELYQQANACAVKGGNS